MFGRKKTKKVEQPEALQYIDAQAHEPSPFLRAEDLEKLNASHEALMKLATDTGREANALSVLLASEYEVTKRRIAQISDIIVDALLTLDYRGNILSANSMAETMFRASERDLIGRTIYSYCPYTPALESEAEHLFEYLEDNLNYKVRNLDTCKAIYQNFIAEGLGVSRKAFSKLTLAINSVTTHVQCSVSIINPEASDYTKFVYALLLKDVTSEVLARERVENMTRFQLSLLAAMPNAVMYRSADLRIAGYNKAFSDLLEIDEQVVGKYLHEVMPSVYAEQFKTVDSLLVDGSTDDVQIKRMRLVGAKTRAIRSCVVYSATLRAPDGSFDGTVSTIVDISELKTIQSLHDTLLETIHNPICVTDASLRYTTCNESFANLMGRNKAQIVGKTYDELLSPELLVNIELQEIAKASKRVDLELSLGIKTEHTFETKAYRRMSQSYRDMLAHRSAIIRDGKFDGTVTVLTDVTDIRAKEKLQRQVMDAVPHPVFIKDSTLSYQEINSAMESWFAIHRATILGGTWDKLLVDVDRHFPGEQHPNFIRRNMDSLKKTLELIAEKDAELFSKPFSAPQVFDYNLWNIGNGEYRDVVFRRHGMYSDEGDFMGVAGIIEDVSQLKNTERMLDSICELTGIAAYRINTKGSVVDCNVKLLELLGVDDKQIVIRDLLCKAIRPFIISYDAVPVRTHEQFDVFDLGNGYENFRKPVVIEGVRTGFIHLVVKCKGEQDAGESVEGKEG